MPPKTKKTKLTTTVSQEINQWLFLTKASIWISRDNRKTALIKLRHPKTDCGAMFLSDGKELHEILHFKPKYSSWFLENSVMEDGSLYVNTPVDPLYLILPYLKKYASEKFMALDQIVIDDEFPECFHLLSCCSSDQLGLIADLKGDENIKVCRLNKTKAFEWLKLKVDCVVEQLKRKNVQVTGGAQVATYIRSNKNSISQDVYLLYAHGLISDYLGEDLSGELFDHLGLKKAEEVACEEIIPPAKRAKLEGNKSEPLEDYCKNGVKNKNNKKVSKLTIAQKQLKKVDKSGMKTISAFFKPKLI